MSVSQHALRQENGSQALRRIGLLAAAILAGIALFSTMASSASAKTQKGFFLAGEKSAEPAKQPRFEGESYPTYLYGDEDTTQKWTFQGETLQCPRAEFFGKLSSATSELQISTAYYFAECGFSTGGVLTISGNGCEPVVKVLNSGPPYVGEYAIKCPTGKSYELVQHLSSITCTYAIPAQTGLNAVSLENKGSGKTRSVQIAFNVSGLKHTISTNFPLLAPCGKNVGTHENGTYTGTITLEGYNEP